MVRCQWDRFGDGTGSEVSMIGLERLENRADWKQVGRLKTGRETETSVRDRRTYPSRRRAHTKAYMLNLDQHLYGLVADRDGGGGKYRTKN